MRYKSNSDYFCRRASVRDWWKRIYIFQQTDALRWIFLMAVLAALCVFIAQDHSRWSRRVCHDNAELIVFCCFHNFPLSNPSTNFQSFLSNLPPNSEWMNEAFSLYNDLHCTIVLLLSVLAPFICIALSLFREIYRNASAGSLHPCIDCCCLSVCLFVYSSSHNSETRQSFHIKIDGSLMIAIAAHI